MARRRIWKNKPGAVRDKNRVAREGKAGRKACPTKTASKIVLTVPEDVVVDVEAIYRELSNAKRMVARGLMAYGMSIRGAAAAVNEVGI